MSSGCLFAVGGRGHLYTPTQWRRILRKRKLDMLVQFQRQTSLSTCSLGTGRDQAFRLDTSLLISTLRKVPSISLSQVHSHALHLSESIASLEKDSLATEHGCRAPECVDVSTQVSYHGLETSSKGMAGIS